MIVAAAEWLHWPGLMEAALAALFTCLCDAGGPLRRRIPALLAFVTLGGLIIMAGGLVRALGMAVALPFAFCVIFCGTYARIYGQSAQQVGTLLCVVMVFSLDRAVPDLATAAALGAMFVGGGAWATLLTLGIWRLHPYLPVRQAVATAYRTLAALAQDLASLARETTPDTARWDRHANTHRRAMREALEGARGVVIEAARSRGPASLRANQASLRLETAEQLFGTLIALSDLLEASPEARGHAARVLRCLRLALALLGHAMLGDSQADMPRITRALEALALAIAHLPSDTHLGGLATTILERLQVAATIAIPETVIPEPVAAAPVLSRWRRLATPLRANANWTSLAFRHALRAAVAASPALAFTLLWFTQYDHWLTITIVTTMQPYFGNTFARALERVGGTLLGGLIAAVLGLFITTPLQIAVAMFPLAIIAFAIRTVSFGLFMAALTPAIVLLVELGQPGAGEWIIAGIRAGATAAGGVIAIGACYLLWPSWEPNRLPSQIRAAIAAHASYADAVFAYLMGESDAKAVDQSRRLAGLATNNTEAAISRALLEPTSRGNDRIEAAMVIDAALRRFAGRLTALQFDPPPGPHAAWRGWIVQAMRSLAALSPDLPPRPADDAPPDILARIARQIELMASTLARIKA